MFVLKRNDAVRRFDTSLILRPFPRDKSGYCCSGVDYNGTEYLFVVLRDVSEFVEDDGWKIWVEPFSEDFRLIEGVVEGIWG